MSTTEDAPFSVLRASIWDGLTRRLDEAPRSRHFRLERTRAFQLAREAIERPVTLLELMAAEAPAALGDDVLAAERLRMLFHLSWLYGERVHEVGRLATGNDPIEIGAEPYAPGLLDHGALLIVGLAAIRVAPEALATVFLETVHGLALSAAPLEVLARLDPKVPEGDALRAIISAVMQLDDLSHIGARGAF